MINTISSCFLGVLLLLSGPASANTQQEQLPAFDSFSYYRDPLFGTQRSVVAPVPRVSPEAVPVAKEPVADAPKPVDSGARPLAQNERYELQLALDKALSQILKLTVDYEALRTRVETMIQAGQPGSNGWFNSGEAVNGEDDQVQALIDLNTKRLSDRDEQIALLTRRLDAMQTRYDDENVARLLAEKRLKVSKDKQNKLREQSASVNEKIKRLTEQLENNQKSMRELEVELTAEKKLKSARDAAQEVPAEQASPDSSFVAAREWVVSGLKFEEGSAAIELGSIGSLEPLVLHLREHDGLAVQINGYTDNIGSAASNLKLSQERADAVAGYLVEQGIGVHRIKALGYGERRPLASNDTEQGREKNRRVAVLLLD